jgi:hypothetical protein
MKGKLIKESVDLMKQLSVSLMTSQEYRRAAHCVNRIQYLIEQFKLGKKPRIRIDSDSLTFTLEDGKEINFRESSFTQITEPRMVSPDTQRTEPPIVPVKNGILVQCDEHKLMIESDRFIELREAILSLRNT